MASTQTTHSTPKKLPDEAPDTVTELTPEEIAAQAQTESEPTKEADAPADPPKRPGPKGPYDDKRAAIQENYERSGRDARNPDVAPQEGEKREDGELEEAAIAAAKTQGADQPAREAEAVKAAEQAAIEDAEVEITVHGNRQKVKVRDLAANAQKYLAGDQRLEDAKKIVGELRELQQRANAKPGTDAEQTADTTDAATRTQVDEEKLQQIGELIQLGEPGEAARAVLELVQQTAQGSTAQPVLDPAMVRTVLQDVISEQEVRSFVTDGHEDLITDPNMVRLVNEQICVEMVRDLINAGMEEGLLREKLRSDADVKAVWNKARELNLPVRPKHELVADGYFGAQNWIRKTAGLPPVERGQERKPPANPPLSDRLDRKRSAQPQPAQRKAPAQAAPVVPPIEQSRQQGFQEMKKARGQTV